MNKPLSHPHRFAHAALLATVIIFAGGIASAAHAAGQSAYTNIASGKCKLLERAKEGDGEWARFQCKSFSKYRVFVDYDDARDYVRLKYGQMEIKLRHGVSEFSRTGPKMEWRFDRGNKAFPYAVIFRMYHTKGSKRERSTLFVARISPNGGCVVGSVAGNARPNANVLARKMADTRTQGFRCGTDQRINIR